MAHPTMQRRVHMYYCWLLTYNPVLKLWKTTHWFVYYHLKHRVWHYGHCHLGFLEPNGGAGEDTHCYASILIGSD